MSVSVLGATLQGVDAVEVEVEVDLLQRLPRICIVGLAANAVKESGERVRSALAAFGFTFPRKRVVINLAPADTRKEGTGLDLPMAIGVLVADGLVPDDRAGQVLAVGELSLGGEVRPIRGALAFSALATDRGRTLLLPAANAAQARLVTGADVVGVRTLGEVVAWLWGAEIAQEPAPDDRGADAAENAFDLVDVRGQVIARRALEIAAAGAHHLLLKGPPGCGKSMLAQRLPSILPPMEVAEALATTRIHSAAGLLTEAPRLIARRPFRAPHHSVTAAGMIGDRTLRPGEVSLAHNGVLFLDEATEFARATLEVLRQPLEDGVVRVSRAAGAVEYPAAITLVMACNLCPCGQFGHGDRCKCSDDARSRYLARLSGPIVDRVDLHVELLPVPAWVLLGAPTGESSATVRERVVRARRRQAARGQRVPNGRLDPSALEEVGQLDRRSARLLEEAVGEFHLSGRATRRVLKVARTIADLSDDVSVGEPHVAEAIHFRPVGARP
jgi:magnesium chelatase family protein